jgi:hypothetical protein
MAVDPTELPILQGLSIEPSTVELRNDPRGVSAGMTSLVRSPESVHCFLVMLQVVVPIRLAKVYFAWSQSRRTTIEEQ